MILVDEGRFNISPFDPLELLAPLTGVDRPKKTALLIAQQLVAEIQLSGLRRGDVLEPEHEMIARHNVARGTLREALRILELQGVLTMRVGPRGGPVVTAPGPQHLASSIVLLLNLSGTTLRTVFEARQCLEPTLAAWAADVIADELIEELQMISEVMASAGDDHTAFARADCRFHSVIAWGCGNDLFGHFVSALCWITEVATSVGPVTAARRTVVLAGHARLLQSLEAHDRELARAAMREDVDGSLCDVAEHLPSVLDRRMRWE